jgi:hypothetical protein
VNLHNPSAGTIRASLRYPALRWLLSGLAGGNVVIAVLGGFFKCPPAPYETAVMLLDANFLSGPAPTALFTPAVARRGRGQTPLRRLSPRSLVRSRIRRKPARWHDPRFSVTT